MTFLGASSESFHIHLDILSSFFISSLFDAYDKWLLGFVFQILGSVWLHCSP